jgi:hypothetical protein
VTPVRPHTRGISHTSVVSRIAVAIWFAAFSAILLAVLTSLKGGAFGSRGLDLPLRAHIGLLVGFAAAGAWLGPLILRETAEDADAWRIGVWIGALAGLVLGLAFLPDVSTQLESLASPRQLLGLLIGFLWLDVPPAVVGGFAGWTLFLIAGAHGRHSERRS